VTVYLYVEGGGDSKELRTRCRRGYSQLLEAAGFGGRLPRIVAAGGRSAAYDMFKTAHGMSAGSRLPMLLVDSEEVVARGNDVSSASRVPPDSDSCWRHLETRDGWTRPAGTRAEQAQLMVTAMETWIMADRVTLGRFFGSDLQEGALMPAHDLEARSRGEVLQALERATRQCGRDRAYAKGKRSFEILAQLDPTVLRGALPHFERFMESLDRVL
jgi:hypothetical protein